MAERRAAEDAVASDSLAAVLEKARDLQTYRRRKNGQQASSEEAEAVVPDEEAAEEESPDEEPGEGPAETGEAPLTSASEEESPPAASLKYKSHEEAERAYQEAERRMHEATQEAATTRQELAALRQQLTAATQVLEALQKQQEHGATPEPTKVQEPPPFDVKAHMRAAYQRIAELDPTTENYLDREREILADAQAEAFAKLYEHTTLTAQQVETRVNKAVQDALTTRDAQRTQETESERVFNKIMAHAKDAGLDVELPSQTNPFGGLHYNDVMLAVERNLYPPDASEDDAITHVVTMVQKRWGLDKPPERQTAPPPPPPSARQAQARNMPMERQGTGRPAQTTRPEAAEPITLTKALEQTQRRRQI